MRHLAGSLFVAAALIAGCGGKVVVDEPGATGSGGAGGFTTGTTTSTGYPYCGGKQGYPCAPDEFCKWDPSSPCGNADGTGVCTPKPAGCTADCPGVCGCDGAFYCNACAAQQAGVDADPSGTCAFGGGTQYRAFMLYTDINRYVVLKKDADHDRCTVATVAMMGGGGGNFHIQTTQGWEVEFVWMTQGAGFCDLLTVGTFPPLPSVYVKAADGKGDLKQDSATQPCSVSAAFTLAFDGSQPWAPPTDDWSASSIPIEGGCYD
jgi:hypothetical protein